MFNEREFLVWLEQTEDGILPFNTASIKGFNNIFADLSEEEAKKLKRKWRKVWRKILKYRDNDCTDDDYEAHLAFFLIGTKYKKSFVNDKIRKNAMIRRRESVLDAYHDLIKKRYFKKEKSEYRKKTKFNKKKS